MRARADTSTWRGEPREAVAPVGVGDALVTLAEALGRLIVDHYQLLRSELQVEGQRVIRTAQRVGRACMIAIPLLLAGVVAASLGLGQVVGLVLESHLGRFSVPLATLVLASMEVVVGAVWLRTQLLAARRETRLVLNGNNSRSEHVNSS